MKLKIKDVLNIIKFLKIIKIDFELWSNPSLLGWIFCFYAVDFQKYF